MPKNTFIALIAASGGGIVSGLLSLTLICFLLSGFYHHNSEDLFTGEEMSIVLSGVMCFLAPFGICLFFLLPLAGIDKKLIETLSKKELMVRYIPIVSIPTSVLILLVLAGPFYNTNDRYDLLTVLLTLYCASCATLWFFVQKIHS